MGTEMLEGKLTVRLWKLRGRSVSEGKLQPPLHNAEPLSSSLDTSNVLLEN